MNTVLKIEHDGDLRRALLKGTPTYADIDRAIQEIWPGHGADGAKYTDEEGDACTLKEKTFSDFLATAQTGATGSVLRLKLSAPLDPEAVANNGGVPSASQAFSRPWEHVEQGSEAGEENLHTVADLTDAPGDMEAQQPASEMAAVETAHIYADVDAKGGEGTQAEQEVVEAVQEKARPRVHSIHTPTSSPRGSKDAATSATPAEDAQGSPSGGYPRPTTSQPKPAAQSMATSAAADNSKAEALIIDHDMEEKIDLVLAAFDDNGDGHLNFAEHNALHDAAWGGNLSIEVFRQMCAEEGEDPEVGLGRESLMCIYSRCRTLERDFEAAKAKLEAAGPDEQRRRRCREREAKAHPVDLMLKNPLLAVPFALDATERLRQKAASAMTCKRDKSVA
jgi:hypothetical protein